MPNGARFDFNNPISPVFVERASAAVLWRLFFPRWTKTAEPFPLKSCFFTRHPGELIHSFCSPFSIWIRAIAPSHSRHTITASLMLSHYCCLDISSYYRIIALYYRTIALSHLTIAHSIHIIALSHYRTSLIALSHFAKGRCCFIFPFFFSQLMHSSIFNTHRAGAHARRSRHALARAISP